MYDTALTACHGPRSQAPDTEVAPGAAAGKPVIAGSNMALHHYGTLCSNLYEFIWLNQPSLQMLGKGVGCSPRLILEGEGIGAALLGRQCAVTDASKKRPCLRQSSAVAACCQGLCMPSAAPQG